MSTSSIPKHSTFTPGSHDAPLVDGERLVSILRIAMAILALFLILIYTHVMPEIKTELMFVGISLFIWAIISAIVLIVIKKSHYSPWLSLASVIADALVVTGAQLSIISTLPLNFVNGPITMLYFLIIGLAALRKSRRLVMISGIISAVIHLTIAAVCFYIYVPKGYLIADVGNSKMEISILDEVGISIVLISIAWIISYVTNQLRESENHYRSLFEIAPDGIIIASSDRRILNTNHRFSEMLGLPKDRIIGHNVIEFLGQSLSHRARTPTPSGIFGAPTTLLRPKGDEVPIRTVAMPITYKNELCVEMSVRDVTTQLRLQRQLLQSQKMKIIGKLAGGLAHDFNNILGGILGATSLCEITISKVSDPIAKDKLQQQISVIKDCSAQARDIISRLLTFSRTSVVEAEPLDLNTLAQDLAKLCRSTFDDNIKVTVSETDDQLTIEGDSTSLRQAVLNLCINAKDAMPNGGELNIAITPVESTHDLIAKIPDFDSKEEYCCISVSDTGTGMDDKTMEQIFDPLFTTKPDGKGTGLGLSMVFIIARQHGGCVDVISSPQKGSTFKIYLTQSRKSLLPAEPVPDHTLIGGEGKILVVDDDASIRTTIKDMLTQLGYTVQTANNGIDALKKLAVPDNAIDLVLLDMVMPVMSGSETLQTLRKNGNNIRIIITSGFLDNNAFDDINKYQITDHLKKPFTYETLAKVLNKAIK